MNDKIVTIENIFARIVNEELRYATDLEIASQEYLDGTIIRYGEFLKEHQWQMTVDQKNKMNGALKKCKDRLNELL